MEEEKEGGSFGVSVVCANIFNTYEEINLVYIFELDRSSECN